MDYNYMPASTQQFTLKTELKRRVPFKHNVCHTSTKVSCNLTNNTGSLFYLTTISCHFLLAHLSYEHGTLNQLPTHR